MLTWVVSVQSHNYDHGFESGEHPSVFDAGREDLIACWEGLLGDGTDPGERRAYYQGMKTGYTYRRNTLIEEPQTSDGPNGARGEVFTGGTRAACFPAAVCAAATWDPINAQRIGHALAEETKTKSARVMCEYPSRHMGGMANPVQSRTHNV